MNSNPHLTQLNTCIFITSGQQDHFTLVIDQQAENTLAMALYQLCSSRGNMTSATRKVTHALGA